MMKWGRVAAFVAMLPCVASAGPLDELLPRPKEVRETADGPLSVEGLPSGGYALRVRGGKAEIAAVDEAGRRYAEATLSQLRLLSGDALPDCTIRDWPTFPWRGFMHDCGRNFLDVESIKQVIDLMAKYKLNLFHWHLTEYFGWRLESKKYPMLQAPWSFGRQHGMFYTQAQFREVVDYAKARGVTVMPELDVPGHSLAFRRGLGFEFMCDKEVKAVVTDLIDELCSLATPEEMPFIHLGTDESRTPQEMVPDSFCPAWAEAVWRNGRTPVGWSPGKDMTLADGRKAVKMMWLESGESVVNPCEKAFDTSYWYFGNYNPFSFLNYALFAKPYVRNIPDADKLGVVIASWHNDMAGHNGRDVLLNNNFALAVVMFSDVQWNGREKNRPDLHFRMPAAGTPEFAEAVRFENAVAAQRDKVLADSPLPFAWVRGMDMRWRLTDGKTGEVIAEDIPGGCVQIHGFSPHGLGAETAYIKETTGVAVLETWIKSPKDQTVGAWIDFMCCGRSGSRSSIAFESGALAGKGEWSASKGAKVEVNGIAVPPPEWKHPGLKIFGRSPDKTTNNVSETPFEDDCCWIRPPSTLTLKAGWNHVKITAPKSFNAWHYGWQVLFVPILGTSDHPSEVPDLEYSSHPKEELVVSVSASSIQREIDEAAERGGGRVVIPAGEHFMDGPLHLRSNVELHLEDGATLSFTDDPEKYLPAVMSSWEGLECLNYSPFIYACGCTNVAITGKGTLAPKMDRWAAQMERERKTWTSPEKDPRYDIQAARGILYKWGSEDCPVEKRDITKAHPAVMRPQLIQFNRCKGVRIEDLRIRDCPFWTIHLFLSEDVVVRGVDSRARGFNNDGIDIEMTKNVLVENCRFDQGDDVIVVKSGRNRDAWRLATPSENIEIRNCVVTGGHTLLGIGSELSGGVRDVYLHDCTCEGEVLRLFYVKTNERRGGFVENIRMENVAAKKVCNGVLEVETDVLYQWAALPTYEVRPTPINGLLMKNVSVEEACRLLHVRGDSRQPVDGVVLENVRIDKVSAPDIVKNAANVIVRTVGKTASLADEPVDRIQLEGDYAGHLQDVWWDGGTNLWWAHTRQILRTNRDGKILASADVEGHNAGCEVKDGRLYVAVCPMQDKTGGKTTPDCHPQINVYDAETLQLLERHILDGLTDRIGSLAILPDGSFVVGCLRPPDIEKTQVRLHHLDGNYRLLQSVVLDNVEVKLGIETIKCRNGELFLSLYEGDGLLVVLDAGTFKEKRRQGYDGTTGLVFDGASAWCGCTRRNAETGRFESSLIRCAAPGGME